MPDPTISPLSEPKQPVSPFNDLLQNEVDGDIDTLNIGQLQKRDPDAAMRLFAKNIGAPALEDLPDVSWWEVAKGLSPYGLGKQIGGGKKIGWAIIPESRLQTSILRHGIDSVRGIPHLPEIMTGLAKELAQVISPGGPGPKASRFDMLMKLGPEGTPTLGQTEFDTLDKLTDDDLETYLNNKKYPIIGAMLQEYKQKYGSLKGFKYTLANDAFSVIIDAADAIGLALGFAIPADAGAIEGAVVGGRMARMAGKTARAVKKGMTGKTAQTVKKAAEVVQKATPEEWVGLAIGKGFERWAEHMRKNPTAFENVEIEFGFDPNTGETLKHTVNLRELAEKHGGVENVPITALIGDDLPKHIEEAILNLQDSKNPYYRIVKKRYDDVGKAILKGRQELVGTKYKDIWDVSTTGQKTIDDIRATQLGRNTPLAKAFQENDKILEYPLSQEASPTGRTPDAPEATDTPAQTTPVTPATSKTGTRERFIKGNWGNKYSGRYGVEDFDNFIFSHSADGTPNPVFPERLQPRDRRDASSQLQTQKMGREWDSELALDDTSSMNDGAVLVKKAEEVYTPEEIADLVAQGYNVKGKLVVLSGNGRMAAYEHAVNTPELQRNVDTYHAQLHAKAQEYGVTDDIGKADNEVLFREVTDTLTPEQISDLVKEANDPSGKGFRSSEVAGIDASLIDSDLLAHYKAGDHPSLREGLKSNTEFVNRFIEKLPANKRAEFYDASGNKISDAGYERIERAMLVSVFEGEAGTILANRFADVSDPGLVNLRKAVYAALPDLAEIKHLNPDLDITDNLAEAIFKTRQILDDETSVDFARRQGSLFDDPEYENMLRLLHVVEQGVQEPAKLTQFLKWYSKQVKAEGSPDQPSLLPDAPTTTKTDILEMGLGKNFDEVPSIDELSTKWREKEADAPNIEEPGGVWIGNNKIMPEKARILFPRTTEFIEKLIRDDSSTGNQLNHKQNATIIEELARMVRNTLENPDQLTLRKIDEVRTNFHQNTDLFVRQGELVKTGEGTAATPLYYAIAEDFFDLLDNHAAVNPEAFPAGFAEKIKATRKQYAINQSLEDTPIAKKLRSLQDTPDKIPDYILSPNAEITPEKMTTIRQLSGDEGWDRLQKGLLARIFTKSRQLNKTESAQSLLTVLNNINKTNPNKLRTLFGDSMAATLYESANFQVRVFDKRGKWNTPYINALMSSDNFGEMLWTAGFVGETFSKEAETLAKATGLTRHVDGSKVGIIIGLVTWIGQTRIKKAMFSDKGRRAVLEGRSFRLPPGIGKEITANELALVAEWMEKHGNKVLRQPIRQTGRIREKRQIMDKIRIRQTVGDYRNRFFVE